MRAGRVFAANVVKSEMRLRWLKRLGLPFERSGIDSVRVCFVRNSFHISGATVDDQSVIRKPSNREI
jgi:hypothetical protein